MKRCFVLLALLVACRKESPAAQRQPATVTETVAGTPANLATTTVENVIPLVATVAQRCEVGTQLDAKGIVATKAATIPAGVPMHLTIWLSESPKELQVSMRVRDSNHDEVATSTKPANGAKVITLKLDQKLDPGKYRVEGVWGGNVACEQDVEIVAR